MAKPLRSQATRDRIFNEARRLFGERGYERTTIRAIAEAAQINVSMVIRYYGSKEELFATIAKIDLPLPDLGSVPAEKRGEAMVANLLDCWEDPEAGNDLRAVFRAAMTNETVRSRIAESIMDQVGSAIGAFVPPDQLTERMGLINTQLTGLAFSRYMLRYPAIVALPKDVIVRRVGAVIQGYLTG